MVKVFSEKESVRIIYVGDKKMKRCLPAYPLFVKDPNFSIWANGEVLNECETHTWYGIAKKIYGFARVNDKAYCFMGDAKSFEEFGVKKAVQTALDVTAFSTDYAFDLEDGISLKLRFVSPLPPTNLELLSMPTTYMEYEFIGCTAADKTEISLFINRNIAYNTNIPNRKAEKVRGLVVPCGDFEAAGLGLQRQLPLSNNDDQIGADWGYFYVAGEKAYLTDEKNVFAYLLTGKRMESAASDEKYIAAINGEKEGAILVAYDELVSIDYFGDVRKGYYLENHTVFDALKYTWTHRCAIQAELAAFAEDMHKKAAVYGADYEQILFASLRQSAAGHKLIKDKEGNVLFLSKECNSNGCIATVDVSYPSMPLYLLYNTELVKGMMRPILKFARMPVWKYDFAPHDVGTYPACCGQVYGLNGKSSHYHGNFAEYNEWPKSHFPIYLLPAEFDAFDFNMQMPVEECANMLVMFLACYHYDHDIEFFKQNTDLADKWVEYLVKYGLKPDNQLCTDDFAGHLKNNINLAIKAIVGIAAYAELKKACGETDVYQNYRQIAENYAAEVTTFAKQFRHIPITWEAGAETFSLKYNFAFDKLLGLHLFSQELFESELDCYVEKCNEYGTPLDSRKDYTKSDWLMWVAALTENEQKRNRLISALKSFLETSPDRVPFGDWYETVSGDHHEFRARTVQGGCFILLLRK